MTAIYDSPRLVCDDCGKKQDSPVRLLNNGVMARSADGSTFSASEREVKHFCNMECLSLYCRRLYPPKPDVGGIGGTGER